MKRYVQVSLLLVSLVALVGAGLFLRRKFRPPPPRWALDFMEKKIDSETLEIVQKSTREWQRLGRRNSRWKNPGTGAYTFASIMTCPHCGQQIPQPDYPAPGSVTLKRGEEITDVYERIEAEYRCPRCGKCPFTRAAP